LLFIFSTLQATKQVTTNHCQLDREGRRSCLSTKKKD
jgi:hypothetical protein